MPIKSFKLIRIHSTLGCTAITGHRVTATQMKNMVNLIRKSPKIEIPIKSKFKVIKILIQRKVFSKQSSWSSRARGETVDIDILIEAVVR